MNLTRRQAIMAGLFGAGGVGLRALATGLPISILLDPRRVLADPPADTRAQFLLLSTSDMGDPVNCNAPGSYVPGVDHPAAASMAPTMVTIGGQQHQAALPWSTLPAAVLDRACFFHGATNTNVHPDEPKVLSLGQAVRRGEMSVSLFARQLAPVLGTIQPEPVPLSRQRLKAAGRPLANLSPRGLRAMLLSVPGAFTRLREQRDRDLDRINALLRAEGTAAQRAYLDRVATSQTQLRQIPAQLLDTLSSIRDDDQDSQILAACVLFKMRVTPAASVTIDFGADNHNDAGLADEADAHVSGLASLNVVFSTLQSFGLTDQVTFGLLNVFGRTLDNAADGRAHFGGHHLGLLVGKNVRPGVVGGIIRQPDGLLRASGIASATGAADDANADVPFADLLGAYGKTMGAVLGVSRGTLDDQITRGRVVEAAVR